MADKTKYNFNGKNNLAKRNLVKEIVEKYLLDNPNKTYLELKSIFNFPASNGHDVIYNEKDYNNWKKRQSSEVERYFNPINYRNEKIYICNQWSIKSIQPLIKLAKNVFNYEIITLDEEETIGIKPIIPVSDNKIKNIILYGVPGVGKTYSHKKIIDRIERKKYSDNEIFENIETYNELDSFMTAEKENRVKFITFHQSFGYEDFIEGFRPDESGNIKLEDGIFKNIAEMARKNLNKSKSDNTVIDFEGIIKKFQIDNEFGTVLKTVKGNDFEIINYTSKSIHIKVNDNKFSISYAPLEKILLDSKKVKINRPADIVDVLDGSFKGLSTYYFPIFEKLSKYNAENLQKENRKNFYLVIDEINRGNISKIFGELITLIEEDKRNSLHVTLPYSKEQFSIPSNLYIIGTMNSTDKSIALIDIALRRRFTFIHMTPNPELVTKYKKAKEFMLTLNSQLEEEHKIGHSYFMQIENEEDLAFTCKYKIKPLLEEYFYGDKKGLTDILELFPNDV